MSLIREKATESESVVKNITQDIQVLDLAKKNLISSITMMKRLQMLGVYPTFWTYNIFRLIAFRIVNALTQLEDLIRDKKYSEVSQTLSVSLVSTSSLCQWSFIYPLRLPSKFRCLSNHILQSRE